MLVAKPKRLPTRSDYAKAMHNLSLGLEQLKPDGFCCNICGDNDHQAWECHHNPLSIAYQAQHFRCYHCGDIIRYDQKTTAEDHFGSKDQILPECAGIDALGYDNLINILTRLPATWYPALIIHMVRVSHKKNVFLPTGCTRLVRKVELEIRESIETRMKPLKHTTDHYKLKYYKHLASKLKDVIKRALRIKSCWLPGPEENIEPENVGEAQALMDMYNEFKSLVEEEK